MTCSHSPQPRKRRRSRKAYEYHCNDAATGRPVPDDQSQPRWWPPVDHHGGGRIRAGFVAGRLIVSGDAAARAHNILTHELLYRLGFAVYLVEMACQIAMTVLFYELLKPASRTASGLWLLVKCVDEQRWKEQAGRTIAPIA